MAKYGTAPRKNAQGQWVTRRGRVLSSAGQRYWEKKLQSGQYDALGHKLRQQIVPGVSVPYSPHYHVPRPGPLGLGDIAGGLGSAVAHGTTHAIEQAGRQVLGPILPTNPFAANRRRGVSTGYFGTPRADLQSIAGAGNVGRRVSRTAGNTILGPDLNAALTGGHPSGKLGLGLDLLGLVPAGRAGELVKEAAGASRFVRSASARRIARQIIQEGHPLPKALQDEKRLAQAIDSVHSLATKGKKYRDWYDRAGEQAVIIAKKYNITPNQSAQLLAIFSQARDPTFAVSQTDKLLRQWKNGEALNAGAFPKRQVPEAQAVLNGGEWSGRKRSSFYLNMIEKLDPAEAQRLGVTGKPVTVDMWVQRMFDPLTKTDVPDPNHYGTFEKIIQQMAADRGWQPKELQAAAWVAAKKKGIIQADIRRMAAKGLIARTPEERAWQRAADAHEIGVAKYVTGEQAAGGIGHLPGGRPRGSDLVRFTEVSGVRHRDFLAALTRNPAQYSLGKPSLAELKRSRVFLSEDGHAGYRIAPDGELANVFRNPEGIRGAGQEAALQAAHQGSVYLNAFAFPKLLKTYEQAGFEEVGRLKFDPTQAPANWDYQKLGQPDIVFMAFGARPHPKRYFGSWDEAVQYAKQAALPATPKQGLKDALLSESGSVSPSAFARGAHEPLLISHNNLTAQLQKPRSQIAAAGAKLFRRVSVEAQKSKHIVDTPGLRLVTSGERTVKYAGRAQRIEQSRVTGSVKTELQILEHVKAGSPEDVANFWYAQLPVEYRNAKGLQLIRDAQARELEYITSGKALEDAGRNATLKADIPLRANDLSASIAKLDELIKSPPPVNEQAIKAADTLNNQREAIRLSRAKNDQQAAEMVAQHEARKGLVSRYVGLQPTGAEVYMGHRLPPGEAYRPTGSRSVGGLSRPSLPRGFASQNEGILMRTGRLHPSMHVSARDWHSAQVYSQNIKARDDLAAMGTPFEGHVPKGYALVNPQGTAIPPHMRLSDLAQFGDAEELRNQAQDVLKTFIAKDPAEFEAMIAEAKAQGMDLSKLRLVPTRYVDRYYSQFKASKGAGWYDRAIDATVTSVVFARIGYIPKNFLQNVIMAVPHQGPFLLVNAVRAAQCLADPQLRHLLHAEIGFTGPGGAISREFATQKVLGKTAGFMSKVADDPARVSAFLHEAAAEGVISKVRPLLNEQDRQALIDLLTNKRKRGLLNDIRSRSVESMADFSRMTPDQARMARRVLIIPGWLMAGSRYPFHFAATHPIRSALLAYIAMGEPGAPDTLYGVNVPHNQPVGHYLKNFGQVAEGIPVPGGKRFRTGSLDPVNTPAQIARSGLGMIHGKGPFDRTTDTPFDYAQPFAAAAIKLAQGAGPKKSLLPLAPDYRLLQGLVNPQSSNLYPADKNRLERLRREAGVFPIKVDAAAQYSKYSNVKSDQKKVFAAARKLGLSTGQLSKAYDLRLKRAQALDHVKGKGDAYQRNAYKAELQLMSELKLAPEAEIQQALSKADSAKITDIKKFRRYLAHNMFGGAVIAADKRYITAHTR